MLIRSVTLAAAASLVAGAAFAQVTSPPHVDMPVAAYTGKLDPVDSPVPPAAPAAATVDLSIARGEGTPYVADAVSGPAAQPTVTASAPVPDTAGNRKKYRPLSRGGAATRAAGN
ncbi:hypothetical protein BH11PSE2_BH11PSE2_05050 [soil metagenome]